MAARDVLRYRRLFLLHRPGALRLAYLPCVILMLLVILPQIVRGSRANIAGRRIHLDDLCADLPIAQINHPLLRRSIEGFSSKFLTDFWTRHSARRQTVRGDRQPRRGSARPRRRVY